MEKPCPGGRQAARSASRCRSSGWEPSAFETRASPISMYRKLSFATDGRGRRPTSAAVQYAHITADYKKLAALLAQE